MAFLFGKGIKMKTIFIKDDRLREIIAYRNEKIGELMLKGKLESSYIIQESTKEYKTRTYPFYEILFGWDIIVSDDNWKIDEEDNFEITIKKSGKYYCATCEQFFTENVICPLMVCGQTVEGTLIKFIKELRAQRKTLCVRGKAIEGEVAEAIYEDNWKIKERLGKKIEN